MQADTDAHEKRKRSFRRFQFRGVDLEQLLELSLDDLLDLFHARARRKCVPQLFASPLQMAVRTSICVGGWQVCHGVPQEQQLPPVYWAR